MPLMIIKGLAGEPMPVYGQGTNVRDWLFVDDHARALTLVLEHGRVGHTFASSAFALDHPSRVLAEVDDG